MKLATPCCPECGNPATRLIEHMLTECEIKYDEPTGTFEYTGEYEDDIETVEPVVADDGTVGVECDGVVGWIPVEACDAWMRSEVADLDRGRPSSHQCLWNWAVPEPHRVHEARPRLTFLGDGRDGAPHDSLDDGPGDFEWIVRVSRPCGLGDVGTHGLTT